MSPPPTRALVEEERFASGEIGKVATVFLTGSRCPFDCLMCDLWQGMLPGPTPKGALPSQIDEALASLAALPPARQLKVYNGGSFFDRTAVPEEDLPAIAERARRFERLIVECHPALVGESALRFRDLLGETAFEVAMGLETVHPEVLPRLGKRMTPEDFARAAAFLNRNGIAVRAFVLVGLPFLAPAESVLWAKRSVAFAFDCGAAVVSVIPTRPGNSPLDRLQEQGLFTPPTLAMLEEVAGFGVGLARGRVFADLWDLERFSRCDVCFEKRRARLRRMNGTQEGEPPLDCPACRETSE